VLSSRRPEHGVDAAETEGGVGAVHLGQLRHMNGRVPTRADRAFHVLPRPYPYACPRRERCDNPDQIVGFAAGLVGLWNWHSE